MFSLCNPGEIHCLKSGQPTEETRTLLENSEGIQSYPRAEESYNLDDELVLTGDNMAEKILK